MIVRKPGSEKRRGVVLVAVLVVVAILMLVGYQFHRWMNAEAEAASVSNRLAQGRGLADSGLHYATFVLGYPEAAGLGDGSGMVYPVPGSFYDNAALFHRRAISAASGRQGYYSIVVPRDLDDPLSATQPFRFGVEDESGKINVNALLRMGDNGRQAREMLLRLPNMTQETADAILNWTRRANQGGDSANADALYYSSLGYTLKNGPYETSEELLLIRGMTPRLFLGNDQNRNGLLDPEEDDLNGVLDPGLSRFLTLYSRERNVDLTGQPRINVNEGDAKALYEKLVAAAGEEMANFIIGYRIYGQQERATFTFVVDSALESVSQGEVFTRDVIVMGLRQQRDQAEPAKIVEGAPKREEIDFERRPQRQVGSIYELIGAEFEISRRNAEGRQERIRYRSPLQKDDADGLREHLPVLLDKLTSAQEQELAPRININTAPREVLRALPDLTDADVQVILDHRPASDADPATAELYHTPAWLITEAGFAPEVVRNLEPYITARSQVYRMQILGYYDVAGPMVRIEAVVDTNAGRPKILYWRDITELGRGFDLR